MSQIIISQAETALTLSAALPADQHPVNVYLQSRLKSDNSRRNMERYLNQVAGLITGGNADAYALDWSALRYEHVARIQTVLLEMNYAPSTINGMLSAVRGVLKECWRLGQMSAEDYHRAADVSNVKGDTTPAGRDISQGEMLALTEVCMNDDSAAGIRDAAMIGMLYTCGLRRAEIVALDLADLDSETGRVHIRRGKGRKDRTVYISNGALTALQDWLDLRGTADSAAFYPVNKGGKIIHEQKDRKTGTMQSARLTTQAVYNMLVKRGKQANVDNFSPHDFRRTFVGDMLDRGVDVVTVSKMAGHASVTTTGRYDRRGERAEQDAASKLHFPYKSRRMV